MVHHALVLVAGIVCGVGEIPKGGWGDRVHDPILWAWSYFPNVYADGCVCGESVEVAYRHFGGSVRKIIASDVGIRVCAVLCKMQKGKRATTKFGIKINYNS